jgi:hypothetical protein
MTCPKAFLTSALLVAVATLAGGSDAAPKKPKGPKPAATEEIAFDKVAATNVLGSVDLVKCKSTNAPRGEGHVVVKFVSDGTASDAQVDKGPLVGSPVAKCIAKEFKKAKVPAFKGDEVKVGKSFRFE